MSEISSGRPQFPLWVDIQADLKLSVREVSSCTFCNRSISTKIPNDSRAWTCLFLINEVKYSCNYRRQDCFLLNYAAGVGRLQ